MIEIKVRPDSVTVKGHAGYDVMGKDIICAGVSALFCTMVHSIKSLTTDKLDTTDEPDLKQAVFYQPSQTTKTLIDGFYLGVCLIDREYPGYIEIK